MSDYIPNITSMPNLKLYSDSPKLTHSVVIKNPNLELDILNRFAALDGNSAKLNTDDYEADPEKADQLVAQLEGLYLYWNDNCPWHQSLVTFYDFGTAKEMLSNMKEALGEATFRNSRVVMEELFFGLDFTKMPQFSDVTFAPNEPPHHVITRAYTIPKSASSYNIPNQAPALSEEIITQLKNLQVYNGSEILINQVIQNPARELQLLTEIANLDGDLSSISDADTRNSLFEAKLKELEGYDLYVNDPGRDSMMTDINNSYAIINTARYQGYDLGKVKISLEEKIKPENNRRNITSAQVIPTGNFRQYYELTNFID